jgi:hypothetical protein
MRNPCLAALAAVFLLTACSSGGSNSQNTSAASNQANNNVNAEATNSSGFPLYNGAVVVTARDFSQHLDPSMLAGGGGAFTQGAGTYAGHQVIARSDASLDQLAAWITQNSQQPPAGFSVPPGGSQLATARQQAERFGVDFAPFVRDENGHKVGYIVVAMDPASMDRHLGPALGLITKYQSLPSMARGPIDSQVQQRVGMSPSAMLDPASPIGAALAAYNSVKSTNQRAIIVVDAAKQ